MTNHKSPITNHAEIAALIEGASAIDSRVWPRMLSDLIEVYIAHFRRAGLDAAAALAQAQAVVIVLAHYFGGSMVYLPQGDKLSAALRDAEIYRNPDRLSVRELATRYNLSARQIYGILCEQREINRGRTRTY